MVLVLELTGLAFALGGRLGGGELGGGLAGLHGGSRLDPFADGLGQVVLVVVLVVFLLVLVLSRVRLYAVEPR